MDIISRLPGCSGQAADAVSAYTQVKMEDAPTLLKIQSQNAQIFGYVYQNKWPKSWSRMEDPVVPLRAKSVRSSLSRRVMEKAFLRKFYWNTVGKKFRIGNAYSLTEKKDYSNQCTWTTSNWLATQNINPSKKVLNKDVDLGELTSFLDQVIQVELKENVRLARILWIITEVWSNPGFLLSTKFFKFIFTWLFNIFIAGFCDRNGKSSKRSEIKEGELRRHPLHGSAETKNTNKNDDDKVRSELCELYRGHG